MKSQCSNLSLFVIELQLITVILQARISPFTGHLSFWHIAVTAVIATAVAIEANIVAKEIAAIIVAAFLAMIGSVVRLIYHLRNENCNC